MAKRYVAMGVKGGKAKPVHEERKMEARESAQKKTADEKRAKRGGKEHAGHKLYPHLD